MEVIKHIKDLLEEENKQIETIKTGYTTIDNMILGMRRRELVLFASTPGVGKTAMLLNLALNMAKSKTPVLFITYETTARKISEKLLGILAGIDPFLLEKDEIPDNQKDSIEEAKNYLASLPLYISEQFIFTGKILKNEMQELNSTKVKAIFIDSLQFVQYSSQENAEERDIENTMFLKNFARQNDLAIIVSTQIRSRNIPQGKTPTLTDIGGEEELSDMVFILHRPYAYSMDQYVGDIEELIVQLAKNRNGPSATFKLMFSRRTLKIEERKTDTF